MWLLCAGCHHRPLVGESPAEVCTSANHEKLVTVSGYFTPPAVILGCTETCSMFISSEAGQAKGVAAVFRVGVGPDQMKPIPPMTDSFPGEVRRLGARDFQVRDHANRPAQAGDVVRVTGRLTFTPKSMFEPCRLEITRVEVVP